MFDKETDQINKYQKILIWKYDDWNKLFKKTWNLLDHFKVHTGAKPYRCKVCLRRFAQKGNLIKHCKLWKGK